MKDIRRVIFCIVKLYEMTGRARLGEVAKQSSFGRASDFYSEGNWFNSNCLTKCKSCVPR